MKKRAQPFHLTFWIPFSDIPAFSIQATKWGEYELASVALSALSHYSPLFDEKILSDLALELFFNFNDDKFDCHIVDPGLMETIE